MNIIDTNVLLTAAGLHPDADPRCAEKCLSFLRSLSEHRRMVVDYDYEILREYFRKLPVYSAVHRLLTEFLKTNRVLVWCKINRSRSSPSEVIGESWYNELPANETLFEFDNADRKFVAAAFAVLADAPNIVNATDTDWCSLRGFLSQHGIGYIDLCEACGKNC